MSDESRMTVRMPTALYEWIQADAQRVHNSMNAHVVMILESYKNQNQTHDLLKRIEQLETVIAELQENR